jgi:hypothetical protein
VNNAQQRAISSLNTWPKDFIEANHLFVSTDGRKNRIALFDLKQ